MKQGTPAKQCYLCQAQAISSCRTCGNALCEDHEQISVSPQGGRVVRCPLCTRRDHEFGRRTGKLA